MSTRGHPVHTAQVYDLLTHLIAKPAAHNPRGHRSYIIYTDSVYPYHMGYTYHLCACHSHMASVHTFLNLLHITGLCHSGTCSPFCPTWAAWEAQVSPSGPVSSGGGLQRSERQGLDPHSRGEKVARGFTAGGQEIIVDTKPKRPLRGPGNQASPDSA